MIAAILVMAALMAVPRPAHVASEQDADDDHGENEGVLDERLAASLLMFPANSEPTQVLKR